MTKRFTTGIIASALAIAAMACDGAGSAGQPAAAPGDDAPATGAAGSPGDGTTARARGEGGVNITVSSGPAAGTHQVAGETLCVFSNGTWIAGYSDYPNLETQVVIYEIGRDGGTSQQFQYTVVFGDPGDESNPGTMLMLAPQMGRDLETTVALSGGRAEVRLQGAMEDGNRISAHFRCTETER